MAGGCGAEPRASQYGGAVPGGVGTVRSAHGSGLRGTPPISHATRDEPDSKLPGRPRLENI